MQLFFYESVAALAGGVFIGFWSPISYFIPYCNHTYYPFPITPPVKDGEADIWGFQRTEAGIKIECNGVVVLDEEVSPSNCDESSKNNWTKDVNMIEFYSSDSVAAQYRLVTPGAGTFCNFHTFLFRILPIFQIATVALAVSHCCTDS